MSSNKGNDKGKDDGGSGNNKKGKGKSPAVMQAYAHLQRKRELEETKKTKMNKTKLQGVSEGSGAGRASLFLPALPAARGTGAGARPSMSLKDAAVRVKELGGSGVCSSPPNHFLSLSTPPTPFTALQLHCVCPS